MSQLHGLLHEVPGLEKAHFSSINARLLNFCLRPKAKDLGITRVIVVLVLVGVFISKTHATSLSLFAFLIFHLSFYYFLSPYLSIILLYMSTYLPTYVNPPTPTNLHQHTYLPTYLYKNTYPPNSPCQHIPTHVYLPSSTYLPLPIPKYQYRIDANPGAGIGLVILSVAGFHVSNLFLTDYSIFTILFILSQIYQSLLILVQIHSGHNFYS